jgi:type II secretory pathway component GspD/PulD (secretin)
MKTVSAPISPFGTLAAQIPTMKQSDLSAPGKSRFHFILMKHILLTLTLVGIVACNMAGFAQTTSPDNDTTAAGSTVAKDAAQPAAPSEPVPAAAAAPAAAPDAAKPVVQDAAQPAAEAPAAAATQVAANEPAQPAATNPAPAGAAPATETPAAAPEAAKAAGSAAQPGAVIPLIVMDDVPLTDAIRNLARQAGINYMLDPKIGYGQPGPDGKPTAQPNVSIRWENITAEQALTALLNNYTLQLVEDPKSKISRVTAKDPAAPPPLMTKIIQLKYASPSNVVVNAQAILTDKRSKVMPDTRTSQLIVVATEAEMVDVDQLVERLDTQTKQVLIEARVLETTVNPTTMKGVDWTGTLQKQNVSFGNNLQQNSPQDSLNNTLSQSFPKMLFDTAKGFNPATAFLDADGVNATLSFLNTYAEVKEISSPKTVTLDNEKAIVEVGELYPIVNVTAGTVQTSGGSSITYSNLTVRLEVTPRISANDFVNLSVTPSIMKLGRKYTSRVADQNNIVDSFLTRNMTTHVMIPSGNTLVMGGLIQDQINNGNTKVPLLGDIPVLGYLFRSDSKARNKTDLILFVTPTIVHDEDYQPTKSEFLKTPAPKKDVLEGEWSAWDSGKPKDWSKPKPEFDESMPAAQ